MNKPAPAPTATVLHGDCIELMRTLPDNSVDSIVTDPPYGLGFMGKAWDELPPGEKWARECLRVLKPGGHLLAFGGTRTWHRLAVAVEDAGFEIRDSIAWLYGSGFPKSLDVSKAIDKQDAAVERTARALEFTAWIRSTGLTAKQIDAITGTNMGGHFTTAKSQPAVATADLFDLLRPHLPEVPERIERLVAQRTVESQNFKAREVVGLHPAPATPRVGTFNASFGEATLTAPATPDAERWQGWGTALKPAFEPCVVARKPLAEKTVAANVLEYGTGALNIDASRIGTETRTHTFSGGNFDGMRVMEDREDRLANEARSQTVTGRWPANVILDEHTAPLIDEQSGITKSASGAVTYKQRHGNALVGSDTGSTRREVEARGFGDSGGASRFFYVAKAPKRERPVHIHDDGTRTAHPTVKPLTLMRHLVRLVTPPGGTVLEPFAGSGATVEAALLEGFDCIAIEREADYLPLIEQRIARVPGQRDLATSVYPTRSGVHPTEGRS